MTLGVAPYYDISCYIMLRHEVLPHVTTLGVAQVDHMLRHEMLPHVTTLGVAQVVERACVRARQRADGVRTYVRTYHCSGSRRPFDALTNALDRILRDSSIEHGFRVSILAHEIV